VLVLNHRQLVLGRHNVVGAAEQSILHLVLLFSLLLEFLSN
jgi:hypothetical protein